MNQGKAIELRGTEYLRECEIAWLISFLRNHKLVQAMYRMGGWER